MSPTQLIFIAILLIISASAWKVGFDGFDSGVYTPLGKVAYTVLIIAGSIGTAFLAGYSSYLAFYYRHDFFGFMIAVATFIIGIGALASCGMSTETPAKKKEEKVD